jgi:hypothetical protein
MLEPIDPARPDPHDPLAPRSDDPRIGRWWWSSSLFRRDRGRSLFLRWPILVMLMMLLVGLVALVVVVLSRQS